MRLIVTLCVHVAYLVIILTQRFRDTKPMFIYIYP